MRLTFSTAARRAWRKRRRRHWRVNQWLKKAVLLSFRLNDMSVIRGGPGRAVWWDKVPSKFDGWDDQRFRAAGLSRGTGLRRAPLRLRCARRGADAVIRQSRGLCRSRHHDRHLGDGRVVRADRQELPHLRRRRHRRRARAVAGGPGDRRGQLLHRCALGSRRGRGRTRGSRPLDGRLHRRLDQDRRPRQRRGFSGRGAGLRGGRARQHAQQAASER